MGIVAREFDKMRYLLGFDNKNQQNNLLYALRIKKVIS